MPNTSHDIYKLDGEVHETGMSGKTLDVSQFSELDLFDWVML